MKRLALALLAACGGQPHVDECPLAWTEIGPYGSPTHEIVIDAATYVVTEAGIRETRDGGATWTAVNTPNRPWTRGFAVDPAHPLTLYATGGGFFKSSDGGATWRTIELEHDARHLALAPSDPNTIYASSEPDGLFRSSDRGEHWQPVGAGIVGQVDAIAIDPRDANIVYAGTQGVSADAGRGEGVFKTTNGGASWTHVWFSVTGVSIAIDPSAPETVYAGNADGVVRSTDGGLHWTHPISLGKPVAAIAIDPAHPQTLYAGTLDGGVFRSTDGAATWLASGLATESIYSLAIGATVFAGTTSGTYRRDGTAWTALDPALRQVPGHSIEGLAVDPADAKTIYATGAYGGGFVTHDGGGSWIPWPGVATKSPKHTIFDPRDPKRIYTGSNAQFGHGGVFASRDGGHSWANQVVGMPGYVWTMTMDPADSRTIYAGTKAFGLWKTRDGGEHWVPSSDGLPSGGTIFAIDVGANDLYAVTEPGMYRSTDRGAHWAMVHANRNDDEAIWMLARDPQNADTLYAGSSSIGMFRVTNAGRTWTPINTGLAKLHITRDVGILFDPTDPKRIILGTEGAGVYTSTDAGAHWSPFGDGLSDLDVWALAIDPRPPHTLYAGTIKASVFALVRSCHRLM